MVTGLLVHRRILMWNCRDHSPADQSGACTTNGRGGTLTRGKMDHVAQQMIAV
jgi:hypothetical protein